MSLSSDTRARRLYNFRFFFLIEGAILVLLGCLAIIIPSISSSTVTLLLGWLFLISGIIGFIPMFLSATYPGFWWSLMSAVLAALIGIILITNSSQSLYGGMIGWPFHVAAFSPIRKLLVMFFMIEGGASIMFAFDHRREFTARWAWMALSGIVDLMLGAIIILDLSGASEWTMGLLIGINMILGGSALIAMGSSFRRTNWRQPTKIQEP